MFGFCMTQSIVNRILRQCSTPVRCLNFTKTEKNRILMEMVLNLDFQVGHKWMCYLIQLLMRLWRGRHGCRPNEEWQNGVVSVENASSYICDEKYRCIQSNNCQMTNHRLHSTSHEMPKVDKFTWKCWDKRCKRQPKQCVSNIFSIEI